MSRNWLLYLDDMIASAEKIGRLTSKRGLDQFVADEAVFDAVLFNLQVIGEPVKNLPDDARASLSETHRSAPARLRDLIAHRNFALDLEIIWEVDNTHVPALLGEALALRHRVEGRAPESGKAG